MLVELHVRDLGVIEEASLQLGSGMTVLTGETGAGKTLVVEALSLLVGERADSVLVRPGAEEALVEGRFEVGPADLVRLEQREVEGEIPLSVPQDGDSGAQLIVARTVPAGGGRSRAWMDGRMASVSALAQAGGRLVDLYGQHAQQSLFDPGAQRRALDAFAGVELATLRQLNGERRNMEEELDALGGDERARAREVDLLRHQLQEIAGAGLEDADEEARLAEEEDRLSQAANYRQLAAQALEALQAEGDGQDSGALDRLGQAASSLAGGPALDTLAARLRALQADASDVASELRAVLDGWEDDPDRLAAVRARRQLLRDLSRKYGDGITGVLLFAEQASAALAELASADARGAELGEALGAVESAIDSEAARVGAARRKAAPALAGAVEQRLQALAMAGAGLEVRVGERDPGDEVTFLLAANRGEPALPLAKVASGGELARAMLALRLVLSDAPPTMVFDEVDAGVGGEAAVSVGQALAELAQGRQVLVVTHLAQVAAFADHQLVVRKEVRGGRTVATLSVVEGEERVIELARMLSGRPESQSARRHAEELLTLAGSGALHR